MKQPATVTAKIFRYDPTIDEAPRYDTLEVPHERHMRVLDVLDYAVENCGLGLAYTYFCGVKKCGMCGVSVNGKPVLACWEAASPSMVIEPLPNMRVIRDLVVDRSAFEQATLDMEPCLVRKEPYATFPEPLTHTDFEDAFKLMTCIECYVCTASCPAVSSADLRDSGERDFDHRDFVGPATLVQIAKVALHPKDELDRSALLEKGMVHNCISCYRCEQVCPVGIPIVSGAIEPLRGMAAARSHGDAAFPVAFAENVRKHVDLDSASLFVKTHGIAGTIAALHMILKMFIRGKTKLFPKANESARRSIRAIFKAAAAEDGRR